MWLSEASVASESAIKTDQRLSDSTLRSLVDGLVLIDAKGLVAFWNPRAEGLLGWAAGEMLGQRVIEMSERMATRAAAPDVVRSQLQAAFEPEAADAAIDIELLPASNHRVRIVSAQVFPLCGEDGGQVGTGILLRDITRERESDAMKSFRSISPSVSSEKRTQSRKSGSVLASVTQIILNLLKLAERCV